MLEHPFKLFQQFPQLRISMLRKEDNCRTDTEIGRLLKSPNIASLNQVHGNRTIIVRAPTSRTEEADGLITDVPELLLSIRWADCQNFVIYEPKKHVLGLLHVGWRGLIADAIPNFFAVLKKEWNVSPDETFVGAGPSLCAKCAEFTDPKRELPNLPREFIRDRHVDLRRAADSQFKNIGVPVSHFERSPDCTCCHPDLYWTYRGGDREAVKAGQSNVLTARFA